MPGTLNCSISLNILSLIKLSRLSAITISLRFFTLRYRTLTDGTVTKRIPFLEKNVNKDI